MSEPQQSPTPRRNFTRSQGPVPPPHSQPGPVIKSGEFVPIYPDLSQLLDQVRVPDPENSHHNPDSNMSNNDQPAAHENAENAPAGNVANAAVASHSLLLPNFWQEKSGTWFNMCKSVFTIRNVTDPVLKYHHCIAKLPRRQLARSRTW